MSFSNKGSSGSNNHALPKIKLVDSQKNYIASYIKQTPFHHVLDQISVALKKNLSNINWEA